MKRILQEILRRIFRVRVIWEDVFSQDKAVQKMTTRNAYHLEERRSASYVWNRVCLVTKTTFLAACFWGGICQGIYLTLRGMWKAHRKYSALKKSSPHDLREYQEASRRIRALA